VAAGARCAVTQLGYDATQFKELMDVLHGLELELSSRTDAVRCTLRARAYGLEHGGIGMIRNKQGK
jgi:hypothetical protein